MTAQNLTDALSRICIVHEIPCLDLYPVMAANDPGRLFFLGKNNHWNARGQDLAARETAGYLLETHLNR